MDRRNNQPPMLDLNNLDKDHEIRFYYDRNGNLTRIRKVQRLDGCAATFAIFALIGLAGGVWWMMSA